MNAESVLSSFKGKFGRRLKDARIGKAGCSARKKCHAERIWFSIPAGCLKEAVRHLMKIQEFPHFSVCSGYDAGKDIEIIYHFTLDYGHPLSEITLSMKVSVPKTRPVLPTITDLIPGALISEREVQEMLGVKVEGIPDPRRLFIDGSFPEGVYPWRRDGTGPEKLVRDLHEGGKNG